MNTRKMQEPKGPKEIEISSKSMSLAEGVVIRGYREMKSNSTGFIRDLGELSTKATKNPAKSWEKLGKIITRNFEFNAKVTPPKEAFTGKRTGRNQNNKNLNQLGMWYIFERISPKLIRVWLTKPYVDESTKRFEPDFFPVCNISHHALSRIFYRKKSVNSFQAVIRELMCPELLNSLTILAFGRESRAIPAQQLDKYLELAIDFADLGVGSTAGCVETKNGIFLLREPDPDYKENPEPNTFAGMFHRAIPNKTILVASTWVPKEMVKPSQLDFIRQTHDYWQKVKSYASETQDLQN